MTFTFEEIEPFSIRNDSASMQKTEMNSSQGQLQTQAKFRIATKPLTLHVMSMTCIVNQIVTRGQNGLSLSSDESDFKKLRCFFGNGIVVTPTH